MKKNSSKKGENNKNIFTIWGTLYNYDFGAKAFYSLYKC